jgi:hypothetical protein
MATEDGECVTKVVTLPASLINDPATVEIWYHAYVPKGHLIVDIEPAETVDEAEGPAESKYVGFGDSLEYVGEDEPTEETSEEDDNGSTFAVEPTDYYPKGE